MDFEDALRAIAGILGALLLIGLAMYFFGVVPVLVFLMAGALITTATSYR